MVEGLRDIEEVDMKSVQDDIVGALSHKPEPEPLEGKDEEKPKEAEAKKEAEKPGEDYKAKAEKLEKEIEETKKALKRVQDGKYAPDAKALQDRIDKLEAKLNAAEKAEASKPQEGDDDVITKGDARKMSEEAATNAIRNYQASERQRLIHEQAEQARAENKEHFENCVKLVEDLCRENPAYIAIIENAKNPAHESMVLAKLHPEYRDLTKKIEAAEKKADIEHRELPKIDDKVVEKGVKNAMRPTTSAGMTGGNNRISSSEKFNRAKKVGTIDAWSSVIEDATGGVLEKLRAEE